MKTAPICYLRCVPSVGQVRSRCGAGVSPMGTAPHGRHTGITPARHRILPLAGPAVVGAEDGRGRPSVHILDRAVAGGAQGPAAVPQHALVRVFVVFPLYIWVGYRLSGAAVFRPCNSRVPQVKGAR